MTLTPGGRAVIARIDTRWKSAAKRAVRSFVAAFLGVYGIPQLLDAAAGRAPVDVSLLRAAAVAGTAAVVTLAWRAFLDPSPLPSLNDAPIGQPGPPA